MLELLRIQTTACHSNTNPASTPSHQAQAERVKRPIHLAKDVVPCGCPVRKETPPPQEKLPFQATDENDPLLKEWLLNYYSSSTFNNCTHQQLPGMAGPPWSTTLLRGPKRPREQLQMCHRCLAGLPYDTSTS